MSDYALPPSTHTAEGKLRRVGVEIEFVGLSVEEAAEVASEFAGSPAEQDNPYRYTVTDERFGEYEIAFDTSLLRDGKSADLLEKLGLSGDGTARAAFDSTFTALLGSLIPREVVTPPIPITELAVLDGLENALREHGARGTRAGVTSAMALHFNPEVIDVGDADHLTRHLRAFVLLYRWLFREGHIDRARRLSPFIAPFPEDYVRLVAGPNYRPNIDRLVSDYVRYNPTRNRPLDLMPVFALEHRDRLAELGADSGAIKARPTFHYRLPNSEIDDPGWSIAREWNRWVVVERLADDRATLEEVGLAYLSWQGSVSGYLNDEWVNTVEEKWVSRLTG